MEWHYYTNKATKRKIDFLLEEAAIIFANCDNSYAAKKEAQEKEQEILSKIKHWIVRKKAKDKFAAQILEQLNQYDKITFKSVTVKIETNLRYDIDNCVMVAKFALDAFKDWGGIPDDSKKYIPKLTIEYNPELEKNTSKVFFKGVV